MADAVYWITGDEVFLATHTGARIAFAEGDPPPLEPLPAPPPEGLQGVLRIRVLVGDPIAASLVYAERLPASALEGSVYTTGDGVYQQYRRGSWAGVTLQLDDGTIQSIAGAYPVWQGAGIVVNALIARLNPLDYLTSGTAGGQSVSFPSVSEVLAFFQAKKQALASMALSLGYGARVGVKPFPVGGRYD